jgi:general secretion pathway protein L
VTSDPVSLDDASEQVAMLLQARPQKRVILRLAPQSVFRRRVDVPVAALGDAPRVLALDLERSTPFRAADVYTAQIVSNTPAVRGKVAVSHFVVKRRLVDDVVTKLQSAGIMVSAVDCQSDEGGSGLGINLLSRPASASDGRGSRLLMATLIVGVIALSVSALAVVWSTQQDALSQLQPATARLRTEATTLRQEKQKRDVARSEMLAAIRFKTALRPVSEILDELTALLPDTAWLTELKIDGDAIEISGLAQGAARLPQMLERSATFAEATLAAPLTLDQADDRERFTIRAKLKAASNPQAQSE